MYFTRRVPCPSVIQPLTLTTARSGLVFEMTPRWGLSDGFGAGEVPGQFEGLLEALGFGLFVGFELAVAVGVQEYLFEDSEPGFGNGESEGAGLPDRELVGLVFNR